MSIDGETRKHLEWVFDFLDEDLSGFIEEKEGLMCAKYTMPPGSNADCGGAWQKMKDDMDSDGDGKISKDEFVQWMAANRCTSAAFAQQFKAEISDKVNQHRAMAAAYDDDFQLPLGPRTASKLEMSRAHQSMRIKLAGVGKGSGGWNASALWQRVAKSFEELRKFAEAPAPEADAAMQYVAAFSGRRDDAGVVPEGGNRDEALHWLHAALTRTSAGETHLKPTIPWLMANYRLWPKSKDADQHTADEPGFASLKEMAISQLRSIEEEFASAYTESLGQQLGGLGSEGDPPPTNPVERVRQDVHGTLRWPTGVGVPNLPINEAYLYLLRIAALAIDGQFQRKAVEAYTRIMGSEPRHARVKSFQRMWAKLQTDHRDAADPKPAENIDVIRTAWEVPENKFGEAYEEAARVFGRPVRVKNNYAPSFDTSTTGGYRALLANYVFDTGLTWGELYSSEEIAKVWIRAVET